MLGDFLKQGEREWVLNDGREGSREDKNTTNDTEAAAQLCFFLFTSEGIINANAGGSKMWKGSLWFQYPSCPSHVRKQ